MKRVFVFYVGGTGIRVMKSVIMLMAAGMDTSGYTVVPIVIDPHLDLKERTDLDNLIINYSAIYNNINEPDNTKLEPTGGFFNTKLEELSNVSLSIQEKRSFGEYIEFAKLKSNDPNRHLIRTIFSQRNLDNELSVGFKGSPNVGTVVLGEIVKGNRWFESFCNEFQDGDRVFIISSIFGGTGASGYPIIENKIKKATDNPAIQKAIIGAITVLPYYKLGDREINSSDIDSANFITKAKSALSYYERREVQPDYLYYIGDRNMDAKYENNEAKQEDHAHFIELIAATSLFHFLHQDKPELTKYMSRAIKEDSKSLSLSTLGDDYSDVIKAIADLTILNHLVEILPSENCFPLSITKGFKETFYNDSIMAKLHEFLDTFHNWYDELSKNSRSFTPLTEGYLGNPGKMKKGVSSLVKDISLEAKDDSYYLLEMIREGNKDSKAVISHTFRNFMRYSYNAINHYTKKIIK